MRKSTRARSQADGRIVGRIRKERIAQMIREAGFMSSTALAEVFNVSEMTVRRDLAELETQGRIQRTHGGAVTDAALVAEAEAAREPFFDERDQLHLAAKMRIAAAAANLVRPTQAVVLDVGTTSFRLAQQLVRERSVRIITNNLRIAALRTEGAAEVYALGGRVRPKEMSLCGPMAVEQARKLWFDIAFIGVSAISARGIFDYSIEETELKQVFLERSTRRVVLADSSKFGGVSLVQIGGIDVFDTLVTDVLPPPDLMHAMKAAGVETIVVPE